MLQTEWCMLFPVYSWYLPIYHTLSNGHKSIAFTYGCHPVLSSSSFHRIGMFPLPLQKRQQHPEIVADIFTDPQGPVMIPNHQEAFVPCTHTPRVPASLPALLPACLLFSYLPNSPSTHPPAHPPSLPPFARCVLTPGIPSQPMLARICAGVEDGLRQLAACGGGGGGGGGGAAPGGGIPILAEYKYDGARGGCGWGHVGY